MMRARSTAALAVSILVFGAGLAAGQTPPPSRPAPSTASVSDDEHSHIGFAVKQSTLGIALEAAVPVHPKVNVRAGFNFFSISHDFKDVFNDSNGAVKTQGTTATAKLKLKSFATYLDWFPFGGGFHVSPGVVLYNGNEADVTAAFTNQSFTLNSEDLISNAANPAKLNASVKFEKVAPAILIGWGNLVPRGMRRWSVPFEMGIVYSRAPKFDLGFTGSACAPNGTNCRNFATDAGLINDVAKEQAKIDDDISVLKIFPVISVGFAFKF